MTKFLSTLFFFFILKFSQSKINSQSSQDILQSDGSNKRDSKNTFETKIKERCDSDLEDPVDRQFKEYVNKFANSDSGKFLKDLVNNETVSKFSGPITDLLTKDQVESLIQVARQPQGKVWNLVNLVVSGAYALVLGYLTIFSPLSSYTALMISSYVLCSVVTNLCHDLVPLWVVALVGFLGDLAVCLLLLFLENVKRRQICVLSICMLFSKLVYDVHAVIPYEFISPSYTGICGVIVRYVFQSNSFVLLRLLYLVFLLLITASLFMKLPSFVAGEPMELQEIEIGATIMKRMVCFVSGLPAAGFINQIYTGLRDVPNPLGPFTYFVVPTKFRLTELDSYMGLLCWIFFSVVYYELIKNSNENHLLTPPKKRRSWRAYTRTISSVKGVSQKKDPSGPEKVTRLWLA